MSMGGGMPYNQGPHVLDVLSCWAAAWCSVRAATVDTQLQGRPCPGYVTAFIEFEDGTPATFTYNGYGYVQNFEFLQWGETPGRLAAWEDSERLSSRPCVPAPPRSTSRASSCATPDGLALPPPRPPTRAGARRLRHHRRHLRPG